MKLVRFLANDEIHSGILHDGEVIEREGDVYSGDKRRSERHELSAVRILAPCAPSKVVAIGLNYRDHAAELGFPLPEEPIIFLKPSTAVIGPDDIIRYPAMSKQVDYEAELGVVIKRTACNVSPDRARDHILGYTCANDVTARDLQKKDGQWTRAKSFDTFCPIGPWIETDINPDDLLIESFLNGRRRQASRTSQLIFSIDYIVSFVSRITTLCPGDLIITGTPSGIGPMNPGDEIEIRIEGIGSLKNKIA